MRKLFLIALFSLLPSFCAAQNYPQNFELLCPSGAMPASGPTGVSYNPSTGKYRANFCIDANGNMTWQGGSGSTTIGPNDYNPCSATYGAFCDTKFAFDVSLTSANPTVTITSSDSPFTAADVGKSIECVVGPPSTFAGFVTGTTIASFTDALHVTASNNAQFTGTASCAWGHKDDTGMQAAVSAWINNPQGGRLLLPSGIIWISANPQQAIPKWINQGDAQILMGAILGAGLKNSILYMGQNFPITPNSPGSCSYTQVTACVFGASNVTYQSFQVNALGFKFGTATNVSVLNLGSGSGGLYISVSSVSAGVTGWTGITLAGQGSGCYGCFVDGAGNDNSSSGINITGTQVTTTVFSNMGITDATSAVQWHDWGSVFSNASNHTMILNTRADLHGTFIEGSKPAFCGIVINNVAGDVLLDAVNLQNGANASNGGICNAVNGARVTAVNHTIIVGGSTGGALTSTFNTALFFDDGTTSFTGPLTPFTGTILTANQQGKVSQTVTTTTVGPTTIFAVPANGAGRYRVCANMQLTAVGTAGTIAATWSWNNGGAQSFSFPTLSLTSAVNTEYPGTTTSNPSCWTINAANSTNIQITWTIAGATGTPSTSAVAWVEKE